MAKSHHLSLSALLGVFAFYHELHAELPGTGQSVLDLMRAGWSWMEIQRYFDFNKVSILFMCVAAAVAGLGFWRKREPERTVDEG